MDAVNIEVETNDGDKYIDELNVRYRNLVRRYAEYLKTSSEKDRAEQKTEDQNVRAAEEASRKQIELEKRAADIHVGESGA